MQYLPEDEIAYVLAHGACSLPMRLTPAELAHMVFCHTAGSAHSYEDVQSYFQTCQQNEYDGQLLPCWPPLTSAADRYGQDWAARAGYGSQGGINFHTRFRTPAPASPPEHWTTHPDDHSRLLSLRSTAVRRSIMSTLNEQDPVLRSSSRRRR